MRKSLEGGCGGEPFCLERFPPAKKKGTDTSPLVSVPIFFPCTLSSPRRIFDKNFWA